MEELIKTENFKFEPKAITAIFEKFYFKVKGVFSEKELEKVKSRILFLIADEGIYFDNVLRALFCLKELEAVSYVTFENHEKKMNLFFQAPSMLFLILKTIRKSARLK